MSRYLQIALVIAAVTALALFVAGFPMGPG
jgi:uncharacterized membrane protein YqhA